MLRRRSLAALLIALAAIGSTASFAQNCGPFTDVPASDPYCSSILQIYYLGITEGTSPTTFGPSLAVTRQALALMLARAGTGGTTATASRRAILGQFWNTQGPGGLGSTTVGNNPLHVRCDGTDMWVGTNTANEVWRVSGGDGRVLGTWTGAASPRGILAAAGGIYVASLQSPGVLYRIDPTQAPTSVTTVASTLGDSPVGIAFDGLRIWTANAGGSVSIITLPSYTVTNKTTGFILPLGILYDGTNMWVTDNGAGTLLKLDSNGVVVDTVTVGLQPGFPVFDGANIWVPNIQDNSVTVVNAATGDVVTTLTNNGMDAPIEAAFDGQRVLVTNELGDSNVSLWRAADLAPLGWFSTGTITAPHGVCSDGVHFWIALSGTNRLVQY